FFELCGPSHVRAARQVGRDAAHNVAVDPEGRLVSGLIEAYLKFVGGVRRDRNAAIHLCVSATAGAAAEPEFSRVVGVSIIYPDTIVLIEKPAARRVGDSNEVVIVVRSVAEGGRHLHKGLYYNMRRCDV